MSRKEKKEKQDKQRESTLVTKQRKSTHVQDKFKPGISVGGGIVVSTGETHSILQYAP